MSTVSFRSRIRVRNERVLGLLTRGHAVVSLASGPAGKYSMSASATGARFRSEPRLLRQARGRSQRRVSADAKTGAVTVVQRTSSDLRLNPHLHVVFLDGAYHEQGAELAWQALGHLQTREVGQVLQRAVRRIDKYLRRHGLLDAFDPDAERQDPEDQLAASAVSGQAPPAGPQWRRGLSPLSAAPLGYDKPLCASLDGFTLHAATRAGALDPAGREKLLRYVLRPPIAQERIERRPDGLVRIALKRAFADGTLAVEMDPLSLLCRLATSVPPPRFHTVKYAGVLAPASPWRARIRPQPKPHAQPAEPSDEDPTPKRTAGTYRGWAELLKRTFDEDVLECPNCHGRMKLVALVTEPNEHRSLPQPSSASRSRSQAARQAAAHRTGRAPCCAKRPAPVALSREARRAAASVQRKQHAPRSCAPCTPTPSEPLEPHLDNLASRASRSMPNRRPSPQPPNPIWRLP